MELLINTVMLEKTRWDAEKTADPDIVDLLPMIAEQTGYKGVEVWQYHLCHKALAEMADVKAAAERADLALPIVGAYPLLNREGEERSEQMTLLKHMIDCAAALGSQAIKIFSGGVKYVDAQESDWEAARGFLDEALAYASDRNLTVTVETHGNTFGDCVDGMKRLLGLTDHPNLKVCYQPYNWDALGPVLADYDALADDVVHLHLQNRTSAGQSLLDEGDLDFTAILNHARNRGFDGFLCVEFTKDIIQEGPFDVGLILSNAEHDRQFVEGVWGS